jgi:hypothetical protein
MFDHPWIVVIVLVAGFLRWLSQKGEAAKQDSPQPTAAPPPIPRGESQTEEERIRRFLEALGQPAGSTPPPKVAPKREARPRAFPTPLPPLTTVPRPLPPSPAAVQMPPPVPIQRPIFTPAPPQEMSFEVRDISAPAFGDSPRAARVAANEPGLMSRLASREGLRSAIILREVFGPPRSLQPLDPISGF